MAVNGRGPVLVIGPDPHRAFRDSSSAGRARCVRWTTEFHKLAGGCRSSLKGAYALWRLVTPLAPPCAWSLLQHGLIVSLQPHARAPFAAARVAERSTVPQGQTRPSRVDISCLVAVRTPGFGPAAQFGIWLRPSIRVAAHYNAS